MSHESGLVAGGFDLFSALEARRELVSRYQAMLLDANKKQNLIGRSTLVDFYWRHVVDSAQLLRFAPSAKVWADLGSGAGLPGIVLAILLRDNKGAKVHLVESVAKKCEFLASASKELGLPVEVHCARAESLEIAVDVVTARACAPMIRLLDFARPYLARGASGIFLKGAQVEDELKSARNRWRFEAQLRPSLSDNGGRVVIVEAVQRVR